MSSRGERLIEIEAERSEMLSKYITALASSGPASTKPKTMEEQRVAARSFLVELRLSDGLSGGDSALLGRAEHLLFYGTSDQKDHVATVLDVLRSRGAAPQLVIGELHKRFGPPSGESHTDGPLQ